MADISSQFADTVMANYMQGSTTDYGQMSRSMVASAGQIEPGHPLFIDLDVGESRTCDMASVFLDLTNFTGRTFWDSPNEVTRLAHAVLSGFTTVVKALGGHVLGLRGDGMFAGFGPIRSAEACASAALLASGVALDAVRHGLNPRLQNAGISPVQARAGADYGPATFVRSGTLSTSEVNVVGFSSNFAAKCEKVANSWEVVIGERIASLVRTPSILTHHAKSPKRYSRGDETRSYKFYDYDYQPVLQFANSSIQELAGKSLEEAVV